jgi:hypothetical protein
MLGWSDSLDLRFFLGLRRPRLRVGKYLSRHRDYRLIRRELGSVARGRGLRLPLVAEFKRPAAESVLDCANARAHA